MVVTPPCFRFSNQDAICREGSAPYLVVGVHQSVRNDYILSSASGENQKLRNVTRG